MKKGFTIIETIVVIAVIGITLPVLFAIIFTLMRQQLKINRLSEIKRQGDYVLSLMENTIKNKAFTIYQSDTFIDSNIVCKDVEVYPISGLVDNLYFLDKDKQWFGYLFNNNSIASKSADLDNPPNVLSFMLTSSKIFISNFSISCSRNTVYSAPIVQFSFDVCYDTGLPNCATTRPEEITSLHYQSRIKLRNY